MRARHIIDCLVEATPRWKRESYDGVAFEYPESSTYGKAMKELERAFIRIESGHAVKSSFDGLGVRFVGNPTEEEMRMVAAFGHHVMDVHRQNPPRRRNRPLTPAPRVKEKPCPRSAELNKLIRQVIPTQSQADKWTSGGCLMFAVALSRFLNSVGVKSKVVGAVEDDTIYHYLTRTQFGDFDSYGKSAKTRVVNAGELDDETAALVSDEQGLSGYDPNEVEALTSAFQKASKKLNLFSKLI